MKEFIVKIQQDLLGTGLVLIYDENRSFMMQQTPTAEIVQALAGEYKAYFFASLNKRNQLRINGPAPWQNW